MSDNKNIKNLLPHHQILKSDIDIPYKNVEDLFIEREKQNPGKIFLICPGKREDSFSFENFMGN